ncbi:prepilin peptidase [Zavarzinia compransoris]|uniref:Prepilin type IV endopeptidase peptidase domain-containing protein n=1 Tax=Zavarzinia compransoris TaxID=1264899 RepID=A0A317DW23_9PROT|nr:prepilin peptidase [Zavarzinia compransoris]PWR18731.1 hypothetical protein DKG75_17245 [Zavarzinia compransoris]TDP48714.1 type IV leader peptidase family protein [Zavarzinia compransoris]
MAEVVALHPYVGAVLGLLAGGIAWRVNGVLAAHRDLAVPRLGLLWLVLAGVYGGFALAQAGIQPHGAALVVLGAVALAVIGFDFHHRRIPNEWSLAIAALGLADALARDRLVEAAATGLGGALLLFGLAALYRLIRGRSGLGLGDVKLVVGIGIWLGPLGLVWCYLTASVATVVFALGALALRRLADDPPFGPGLLGAMLVLLLTGAPPL